MNYANLTIYGVIIMISIIHVKTSYIKIRNSFLRIYFNNCGKQKIRNISSIYNLYVSKFYDAHLFYYKLTDEEKDILDAVCSLVF
jgi:hypothetical protein